MEVWFGAHNVIAQNWLRSSQKAVKKIYKTYFPTLVLKHKMCFKFLFIEKKKTIRLIDDLKQWLTKGKRGDEMRELQRFGYLENNKKAFR